MFEGSYRGWQVTLIIFGSESNQCQKMILFKTSGALFIYILLNLSFFSITLIHSYVEHLYVTAFHTCPYYVLKQPFCLSLTVWIYGKTTVDGTDSSTDGAFRHCSTTTGVERSGALSLVTDGLQNCIKSMD